MDSLAVWAEGRHEPPTGYFKADALLRLALSGRLRSTYVAETSIYGGPANLNFLT